jgi:hypothetical protein
VLTLLHHLRPVESNEARQRFFAPASGLHFDFIIWDSFVASGRLNVFLHLPLVCTSTSSAGTPSSLLLGLLLRRFWPRQRFFAPANLGARIRGRKTFFIFSIYFLHTASV